MNTDTLFVLFFDAIVIIMGILIKMELHDIKSRIMRLEDKFMKIFVPVAIFLGVILTNPLHSHAQQRQVMGGAVAYPGSTSVLCQSPQFCPRVVAPDWSNTQTMYGKDLSCRKSINGGRTWAACTTQPSATSNTIHIAVASNGNVLSAGNDAGGTVFNIRLSTDGSTSWSTAYTTGIIEVTVGTGSSRLKCARTVPVCLMYYIQASDNTTIQVLTSTDNGVSWANATNGTIGSHPLFFAFSEDGEHAIAAPAAPGGADLAIVYTSGVWHRSSIPWVSSFGGLCTSSYIVLSVTRTICNDTTLGTNITIRNEDGLIQNTFDLSARVAGASTVLLANSNNLISSRVAMVGNNVSGNTSVWLSNDSGLSFRADAIMSEQVSSQYDSFALDNCVYFSYFASGLNGRLSKVCP